MSEVKYKNYLEHEIHVKFVDGILEQSQNWQWFIEYIEDNYNLSDIKSYIEYQNRSNYLIRILSKFTNILEICDSNFQFKTILLQEIYEISKYYLGVIERENCEKKISSEFSKILFLIVWLTKLQNSSSSLKYIADDRFLTQKNFHQSIKIQDFYYDKEEILIYIEKITVNDFEIPKHNIQDNLNRVVYGPSTDFFEKYGDDLLSVNCFNFQSFDRGDYLTWQENTLLDMVQISIRNNEVIPMYTNGNITNPNYICWTSDLLNQLKNYFNHYVSNFVIESVDFLINKKSPSQDIIETHCKLFIELIDNADYYEIISSSTYKILALLVKEGIMGTIEKTEVIKDFYASIQSIESVELLLELETDFSLSKKQRNILKKHIESQYKRISDINNMYNLTQYLKDTNTTKYINQEYYDKTKNKFLELIEGVKDISVANLFYEAMLFLLSINQTNQIVDKRIVKNDMVYLQEYWQKNKYYEQIQNLQEFSYTTQFNIEELEEYNKNILENPISFASICVISKEEDIVNVIEKISENTLVHIVNKIELRNIFPIKNMGINFDRHDIDNILKNQVENIVQKYGYKFLNVLDIEVYITALHNRYEDNAIYFISLFNKVKELYDMLGKMLEINLIPYNQEISLGHLTQLFPILEIEVRHLGKMFGIVPFKENINDFMKFKDPSSILRDLIGDVYEELGNFNNIPDLLFVYHFMYNSNSLNIRNECIHGRDYIKGGRLEMGFKVTLLAIYMVRYRIDLINSNIQKNSNE